MEPIIKKLEWDSDFFGIEIGEVEWTSGDIAAANFELIYVKSKTENIPEIGGYAKHFSEIKVIFSKQPVAADHVDEHIFSVENTSFEISELYELAFESGRFSRFKLDNGMSNQNFEKLYRTWVDNSLNRKYADDVMIYKYAGQVVGLVTYKINDGKSASIGLIAVSPDYQGRGIGRKLLSAVENKLANQQILNLQIPTQLQNIPACTFYSKLGYQISDTTYLMHFWRL